MKCMMSERGGEKIVSNWSDYGKSLFLSLRKILFGGEKAKRFNWIASHSEPSFMVLCSLLLSLYDFLLARSLFLLQLFLIVSVGAQSR